MAEWERKTEQVAPEGLPPEMGSAIQRHIEQYNLGPVLAETLMCVLTESEKPKKGLFGKAEAVRTAVIVTPHWLLWCVDQPKAFVLSAQLVHVTVQDYAQTPFARMVPDSGIEVSGMFTDTSESASAFVGLEAGEAGNRFKETVIQAARDAKK